MKAPIGSSVQDIPANAKYANRWGEPRYLTIGHTFTETGTRVDVVRPWSLVKAIHRHNTWVKNRIAEQVAANNAELLKGVSDEV